VTLAPAVPAASAPGKWPAPHYRTIKAALQQAGATPCDESVSTTGDVFGAYESRSWEIQVDKPCPDPLSSERDGLVIADAYNSSGVMKRAVANLSRKGAYVGDSLIAYRWGSTLIEITESSSLAGISRFRKAIRSLPGRATLVFDRR
jgi:hypothetical protein